MEYILYDKLNDEINFIFRSKREAVKVQKEYSEHGIDFKLERRADRTADLKKIIKWIVEQELTDKKILAHIGMSGLGKIEYLKVDYNMGQLQIGENTYNAKDVRVLFNRDSRLAIQILDQKDLKNYGRWAIQAYTYEEYQKLPLEK